MASLTAPMRRPLVHLLRTTVGAATMGAFAVMLAAPAEASTTVTTLAPTNTNPGLGLNGTGTVVFVSVVVGVLALLLFLPLIVGMLSSYRLQRNQQRFLEAVAKKDLQGDDLKSVLQSFERVSTTGSQTGEDGGTTNQSTTTSMLALATLLLVAFALVIVLVSSSSDATDLRKTIITALLSILASIAGFYFGARTAQQSAKQAQTGSSGSGGDATQPVFISATPPPIATVGDTYTYEFRATGSPAPKYSLVGSPPWLSIDTVTGSVTGVVPTGDTPFEYYATATNSAGQVTAGPFAVTVTVAPDAPPV